jgi:hypothetical protein
VPDCPRAAPEIRISEAGLEGLAHLIKAASETARAEDIVTRDGLRVYAIEAALIKVPEAFFAGQPVESQVALANVKEPSGLLRRLLDGGKLVVAGRLAGSVQVSTRTSHRSPRFWPSESSGHFSELKHRRRTRSKTRSTN